METTFYLLVVGTVLLLAIAVWIFLRARKKKKMINNVPVELLDKLEELTDTFERRYKQDEKTSPYQILWEDARRRSKTDEDLRVRGEESAITGRSDRISREESRVSNGEQIEQSPRGQSIPSISNSGDQGSIKSIGGSKRNSNRNFFSRFRRRN